MPKSTNPYGLRPKLDTEARSVIMRVVQKENDEVVDEHTFAFNDVHETLRGNVALYGLSKLLSDRASDIETGPEKIAAMKEVMAQLAEGTWQKERKAGMPTVAAEVEALAELKQCTVAEAQSALRAYSKEARAEILANPRIVELAKRIREGRQEVDLSDLAPPADDDNVESAEAPASA